ncbi:hypothetical protein HELRODRAFT_101948 [Helobdella robusta]|uniref:NADP-dependent oxidoreductase domain-containing protein n=1 Tax=Helobdella robusta TaxID=6412 RepID=T1ED76_HELRO|nr:hypothetical protein HELRODRAFT_101948 [Helobdella robusta]ESN97994.1 hypothetical protein HELRODRAFT_101948 [Helobdella robusta]
MTDYVSSPSGFRMPAVGLGTWQAKPNEIGEAVVNAIRAGYKLIDCAPVYGNESEIGCAIKRCIEELKIIKREDLFVTSKLWSTKHNPQDVEPALKESLKNLKLDYLDLYLIHWPFALKTCDEVFPTNPDGSLSFVYVDYKETWKAMECCVRKGLVRNIGLSNFNSQQITEILNVATIEPVNLQIEIHPYLQQSKLVDFCRQHKMTVTSYSSFASPQKPWDDNKNGPINIFQEPILQKIAASHKKTVAQVVLRWLNERKIAVVPKSVTPSRILENNQIFDFCLTDEEMKQVSSLNRDLRVIIPIVVDKDGKKINWFASSPQFPFNVEF